MLFKSHVAFGVFVYFLSLEFLSFNFDMKVVYLVFLLLGVFFVDIDHKNSKAGNRWYLRPIQFFFKHRGVIHSFCFAIIFSFIVYLFSKVGAYGFFAGYVSHLILDSVTKGGVALFWPISRKRVSFGIKTGGIFEDVVFVFLFLADLYFVFRLFF